MLGFSYMVNARVAEKTLWSPSTASDIVIDVFDNEVFRFAEGDELRFYLTVPGGKDGVSCHLRYSTDGETFNSLTGKEWPWIASGSTYGTVSLSSTDITALNVTGTKLYFGYNGGTANFNKITHYSSSSKTENPLPLWEAIEFSSSVVSTFVAGDKIRVYCTVPLSGANFKFVYKGKNDDWTERNDITGINEYDGYPWINGGDSYYDITLSSDDITELDGHNIYVSAYNMKSIDRITLFTETPESTTDLWSGLAALTKDGENWGSVSESDLTSTNLSGAKINDVLRITYSSATVGDNAISLRNRNGWGNLVNNDDEDQATASNVSTDKTTVDFVINCARMLEDIQKNGIIVTGYGLTVTKVQLLTYSDSYDAAYVSIGSDGIATYSHIKKLDFSGTGITPYYASAVTTGSVTLTSVENYTTYEYQGYVLRGPEGKYDIPVTNSATWQSTDYLEGTTIYTTNVYKSAYSGYDGDGDKATKIKTYYRYIFAKDVSDIGFYRIAPDYSRLKDATTYYYHELAPHKAYLETPTDIAPAADSRVALLFDDEITSLSGVMEHTSSGNGTVYSLNGMAVKQPKKGLYIRNGKKYFVK